jgi:HAD superfamily hydrolase (TIGR01509 family)
MPSADHLDAVTVDALGTLIELDDPVPRLQAALAAGGVARSPEEIARAFEAEAEYYKSRLGEPGPWDDEAVAGLRRDCVTVFLSALAASLAVEGFVPAFVQALRFHLTDGAAEALGTLKRAGLTLACVSNWDPTLHERLDELGVASLFDTVVTSAEAGAAKPDPRIFRVALARLGVEPARALHVGDGEADREGARAAGLAFASAPLVTLPGRLGLQ